ncbi:hypothetical protein Scep_016651 [Stephania cephalantha]|uniref:Apple domain-containing protein n=1 Tax=Stephania cephalantha TaxID=152367 RepID=A0AAP0IN24_9MAGN
MKAPQISGVYQKQIHQQRSVTAPLLSAAHLLLPSVIFVRHCASPPAARGCLRLRHLRSISCSSASPRTPGASLLRLGALSLAHSPHPPSHFPLSSEFLIMKGSQKFWTSGRWNGVIFSQVPNLRLNDIYNVSFVSNENVTYLTYDLHNTSMISRSVMDSTGKLKKYLWLDGTTEWALFWDLPRPCQVYALCGAFSTCADMQIPNCRCLQGFEPYSLRDWMQQDCSAGCVRKSSLQCGGKDLFVLVNNVKFPVNFESLSALDSEQCKQACSRNCSCNAYAYNGNCHLWMGDLLGIEQLERRDYTFLKSCCI